MIDLVFSEIELPAARRLENGDAARAIAVRAALKRHRWAIGLMESRASPGPATLRHHDASSGCLRAAGFRSHWPRTPTRLLDSYIYGFALQEATLPFNPQTVAEAAEAITQHFPGEYPHLTEMTIEHMLRPGYDFGDEFEIGLNVILDALTRTVAEGGCRQPG